MDRKTSAADLTIEGITAIPLQGQTGDTIDLEGRIANYGLGDNYAVQYRRYLSIDEQVTIDDMALGPESTLNNTLFVGSGMTVTQPITVPAFPDPIYPSYFGLIADPYEFAFDDKCSNNTGSAAFTFTGDPPHGLDDTVGYNYLDAVHLAAIKAGANLEVTVTFLQPPSSTISLLMGTDLDQDPSTTGANNLYPSNCQGTRSVRTLAYSFLTHTGGAALTSKGDKIETQNANLGL